MVDQHRSRSHWLSDRDYCGSAPLAAVLTESGESGYTEVLLENYLAIRERGPRVADQQHQHASELVDW